MKKTLVITILVVILYYIFFNKNVDNFVNDYSNIDFVVPRYNEDLTWTTEEPFNKFKYIVYNKGDDEKFNKTNVKQIITLENVGRCDHTFLYHLIKNYDNLNDIIVFLPGSINMENKIDRARELVDLVAKNNKAYMIGSKVDNVKNYFYDFQMDHHYSLSTQNTIKNPETKLKPSDIRPFGKWFEHHFGDIVVDIYFYLGIFSVDKRDVLQNPKPRYEELLKEVGDHSNPEVGHYLERSWAGVFHPITYTQKKY